VSAIIPTFNRSAFLPEALECLLAQTVPPYEIIVVDDGSTDDTAEVVAKFGTVVRYVYIENSGAPVARNVGAAMARGDWLWFCDSDDVWRPGYLERCRRVAASDPHPEFLFSDFRLVNNGVWDLATKFSTTPPGFWERSDRQAVDGGWVIASPLYASILRFQPIFHSTIVMSRIFFRSVGGYDERFARVGSEDFEFVLRCAARAPIGIVDGALVGIRRHSGNFSADPLRVLLGEIGILRHAKACHAGGMTHQGEIEAEIAVRTVQALDAAFTAGDYKCVTQLGRTLQPTQIDSRSRVKVALASLPQGLRNPAVRLAHVGSALWGATQ
jgi:glycosyltransferase involved in cell wall biosynthesis